MASKKSEPRRIPDKDSLDEEPWECRRLSAFTKIDSLCRIPCDAEESFSEGSP
ncbi:hypothetical protein Hanom_Chr02g00169361 [Helianthus anomalus]